jgi:mRNA interferase RelE/StbE
MSWAVKLHPEVDTDLALLGPAEARNILKVIRDRIQNGEPDKIGKPLAGSLAGYRRIRTGSTRIVYRVNKKAIEVLVIAVGQRRDAEIYATAEGRTA